MTLSTLFVRLKKVFHFNGKHRSSSFEIIDSPDLDPCQRPLYVLPGRISVYIWTVHLPAHPVRTFHYLGHIGPNPVQARIASGTDGALDVRCDDAVQVSAHRDSMSQNGPGSQQ